MVINSQEVFVIQDGGDFYFHGDYRLTRYLGHVFMGRIKDFDMVSARMFRETLQLDLEAWGIYPKFIGP